jgi:putative oxidoreductase
VTRLIDPSLLFGRLLLAWIFLHEGFFLATHPNAALAGMARMGVATPVALAVIALQLAGGAALAIGLLTRLAALGLGVFCIATAVRFHANFAVRNELLHFEKDLAIAGGMFVLAACGAGAWSLDGWLRRRRIRPWARG